MLTSIHVENFRCFKSFKMGGLGRINLIVGENHCGKTTILEAVYLLKNQTEPLAIWNLFRKRGELRTERISAQQSSLTAGISHLFRGHEIDPGSAFKLSATNQNNEPEFFNATIDRLEPDMTRPRMPTLNDLFPKLSLRSEGSSGPDLPPIPLSFTGSLSLSTAADKREFFSKLSQKLSCSMAQYLTTDSLDTEDLNALWDQVVLTSRENLVLRYLRCLDSRIGQPDLQREMRKPVGFSPRSGILVKHRRFRVPIPISTMGDGIWRLFSLATVFSQCRNGVLLVDEVDLGLPHRSLPKIWELVFQTAKELDAQVFATTRSWDCVKAFGRISEKEGRRSAGNEGLPCASLQRIERGNAHAISYAPEEIQLASKNLAEAR